jgi:hypothetical protein
MQGRTGGLRLLDAAQWRRRQAGAAARLAVPVLKIGEDAGGNLRSRDRVAEVVPVGLIAVRSLEKGDLLGRLDALDRNPHAKLAAERDDRLDDRLGFPATAVEGTQEAAVDLDLVERRSLIQAAAGLLRRPARLK